MDGGSDGCLGGRYCVLGSSEVGWIEVGWGGRVVIM